MILADVAREDASVVISDAEGARGHRDGAISVEPIDTQISEPPTAPVEHAKGAPSDAVVWEEVEARTTRTSSSPGRTSRSWCSPALLAAVGIYQDSAILMVGAMVVGPEFGPLAGLCVALVQRPAPLALRSAVALAVGFPAAIATVYLDLARSSRRLGLFEDQFSQQGHSLANIISQPDFFTFFVAGCAGAADAEPEHRQVGRADRRADLGHDDSGGGQRRVSPPPTRTGRAARQPAQLAINLGSIVLAGTAVLFIQRLLYLRRKARARRHTDEPSDDQISIFVLIFSTTASVNSVVVACPPRSNVLTPPAVVSSVLS